MFNQILALAGKTMITNVERNAKRYPVFTSIVLNLANGIDLITSDCKKDYYTMAINEYELSAYFNSMKFDYLLLHNLFIDHREYSTLEEKKRKIQDAIMLNSKLNLVINADDPLFYDIDEIKNDTILNKKRTKIYYGFNKIEFCDDNNDLIQKNDVTKCPSCGCSLDYRKRFYSHLGHYDCECGFRRPRLDISADARVFSDYTFLTVYWADKKYVFKLPLGGVYNAYNALGAIALAITMQIDRKTIAAALEKYMYLQARDEVVELKNKNIKVKVIKNPTSLSEAIRELYGSKNTKVVFCLNDEIDDGVDTSWIWDANFTALKGFENKIYVCANRFDDMALRIKYSGVNPCLMIMDSNVKSTVECCFYDLESNENMLVLTTPSLVDEVYSAIKR